MRLQNLLPPEAIQSIRQIWHEIYGPRKSSGSTNAAGSDSASGSGGTSLSSMTAATSCASSTSGTTTVSATSASNTATLREHFARRVRQVVRQYLGPNALVSLNRASVIVPPLSNQVPTSTKNPGVELRTVAISSTQTVTAPVLSHSAPVTQLSQVISPQGKLILLHLPISSISVSFQCSFYADFLPLYF